MEKLTMKNVKEVLRLKLDCNLSARKIAQTCGFARSTGKECQSQGWLEQVHP